MKINTLGVDWFQFWTLKLYCALNLVDGRHWKWNKRAERWSFKFSELEWILSFEHSLFCCKCAVCCNFVHFRLNLVVNERVNCKTWSHKLIYFYTMCYKRRKGALYTIKKIMHSLLVCKNLHCFVASLDLAQSTHIRENFGLQISACV